MKRALILIGAALISAAICALVEACRVIGADGGSLGQALLGAGISFALHGFLLLSAIPAIGLVLWGLRPAHRQDFALAGISATSGRARSSLWVSLLMVAALQAGVLWKLYPWVGSAISRRSLQALAMALVGVGSFAAAGLAFFPIWRGVRRIPWPRPAMVFGGLALVAAIAAWRVLAGLDWRIIDFAPWIGLGLAAGTMAMVAWWLMRARSPAQLPVAWSKTARAIAMLTPIGLLLWAVALLGTLFGAGPPATEFLLERGLGSKLLLAKARVLFDRDGDGFSSRFGGGDCDDRSVDVSPAATEIPGNGVDDDCEGGDATPKQRKTPVAEAPVHPALRFDGNWLLVTIDALRVDRVRGKLMPNLAELAHKGAFFTQARSQAPNTPRSFPSMLTARFPSQIAWQQSKLNYSPLKPENETLFERLSEAGFRTVGIFSNFYFSAERNINQGVAEWSNDGATSIADSNHDISAPRITERVLARLKKASRDKEKFVLWTHLLEPHSTYMEHPGFPIAKDKKGTDALEAKYDGECAFVDQYLGKILSALGDLGLRESTAIVVFSDHGEAFGEHGLYFHGESLYDEMLRVPLVFYIPGQKPMRSDVPVMLVDVAPTVLELAGAKPLERASGQSLAPVLAGQAMQARPLYAEILPSNAFPRHLVAFREGPWKLIYKLTDQRFELYNVATDPKEQVNLWSKNPRQGATMRKRMAEFKEEQN